MRNVRDLASTHPSIHKLLDADEVRRREAVSAPWRRETPLFASAFERRRLRVLNSLFSALQAFGAQPFVSDAEARRVGAVVGVQGVSFRLDHPSAKPDREGRWPTREGWGLMCFGSRSTGTARRAGEMTSRSRWRRTSPTSSLS